MRYYIKAFKNYKNDKGRASRKEMWMFAIFHWLIMLPLYVAMMSAKSSGVFWMFWALLVAYGLVSLSPSICLQVRRLHDVNKSGFWWFLGQLPVVSIYVLYLYFIKKGDIGKNKYGQPSEHKLCTKCGAVLEIDSTYCGKCGEQLLGLKKSCKSCGAQNPVESVTCSMCGAEI